MNKKARVIISLCEQQKVFDCSVTRSIDEMSIEEIEHTVDAILNAAKNHFIAVMRRYKEVQAENEKRED